MSRRIDVLFVSELRLWPLDQGFKVHGVKMAEALAHRGLAVRIATLRPTQTTAMPGSLAKLFVPWPRAQETDIEQLRAGWSGWLGGCRQRLAERQALDRAELAGIEALTRELRPRAVVALGRHGAAMIRSVHGARRIWYAADDPTWFHLTLLRTISLRQWTKHIKAAMFWALFERAFAYRLEGCVAVSTTDRRWLSLLGGVKQAITVPNGVDLDYFSPGLPASTQNHARTLIFWGRLDFEPNIDAAVWFARSVFPSLRHRFPDIQFQILGKHPCKQVRQLGSLPGVRVIGEVPDIRVYALSAAAVVLPMRCGGGIKNKLLEAAAMGKAVIATPRAVRGVVGATQDVPAMRCRNVKAWVDAIGRVFEDRDYARRQGELARAWAQEHHRWDAAAKRFASLLESASATREQWHHPEVPAAGQTKPSPLPMRELSA